MSVRRIVQLIPLLLLSGFLAACRGASPTATPQPTLTPSPVGTLPPSALTFTIDPKQSIINYYGTGALNVQFPGTFGIAGQSVVFVPEGNGYRLNLNLIIDGKSVTAINGLVYNALYNNMEIDKFPTAQLVAASKEIISLDHIDTQPATLTASGTLMLHGQSRIIDIAISFTIKDGKLQATGSIPSLDLLDYGINVPTAIFNSKLNLKATVVAVQVANATPSSIS